jgi:pSer/pThr/pTyr-binding forkhead associated (FHA) protein
VITCKRCGKDNQDHYKFCLGCGSELSAAPAPGGAPGQPGGVAMMKTVMADMGSQTGQRPTTPTPPGGVRPNTGGGLPGMGPAAPAPQPAPMPAPMPQHAAPAPRPAPQPAPQPAPPAAAAPQAAAGPRRCPSCSADVPTGFAFCGQCGTKIGDAAPARNTQDIARQPQAEARPHGTLVLIRPDGSEGGSHALQEGENRLGRDHGEVFENDGYLSPSHAELVVNAAGAVVRDLDSLNGVFLRMTEEELIEPGQILRVGQELLRFDLIDPPSPTEDGTEVMGSPNPGFWGKLSVIIGDNVDGSAYPLLGDSVTLGRERGDINFPDDGYVSGLHARLTTRDGGVYMSDLGSSNGTFIKVNGEREVKDGSFILLGQQLFKLSLRT